MQKFHIRKSGSLKFILVSFILAILAVKGNAQNVDTSNIIQLSGVVLSADSLRAVPMASIIVKNDGRGTIANDLGIFSIVVQKGDRIKFSSIGYKDIDITIPTNLTGKEYNVIQLMVEDTVYLPATIIRPKPTPEEYARDFLNTQIPDDLYEIARQNNDASKRRILMASLPLDGREAFSALLRKQTAQAYYKGQLPPQNIFNPLAWADFIKAWKRGDFKRKDY